MVARNNHPEDKALRDTGDEERNMGAEGVEGIWCVAALVTYISARFYSFISYVSPLCTTLRNLATKKNLTNRPARRGATHRGRFMGFRCTSLQSLKSRSELGDKRGGISPSDLRKARNGPGQLIKQTAKLSIKMFAQPRLRRFLSRDKVHNFRTAYKPRCAIFRYIRVRTALFYIRLRINDIRLSIDT
ncbi:hypothetical protein ALC56_07324 [Trachymyrmex septentrionalis]|uniref:Uncharacterized protein n=1 Tax=Trachymyrmex septentrionalis TaxID=34720 RepID=A0A195FE33_9HYME|nr:hypothetical protein ALC56_07324 [Trachymyrmex septentrionalis]